MIPAKRIKAVGGRGQVRKNTEEFPAAFFDGIGDASEMVNPVILDIISPFDIDNKR